MADRAKLRERLGMWLPWHYWAAEEREARADRSESDREARSRRRDQKFAAPILFAFGVGLFILGGHDVVQSHDLEMRFAGLTLTFEAVLLVVAAFAIWARDEPWSRLLAFLAGCLLMATAGLLILALETVGDGGDVILLWLLMALAGLLVAALVFRKEDWGKDQVSAKAWGGLASLATISFLFTVGQFYYSAAYVPSRLKPALTVVAKMEPGAMVDGLRSVAISFEVSNTGPTSVRVLASSYTLQGADISHRAISGSEYAHRSARPAQRDFDLMARPAVARRTAQEVGTQPLQSGRITSGFDVLEPEETFRRTIYAFVPVQRYRFLRLTADVWQVRADKLEPAGRSIPDSEWPAQARVPVGDEHHLTYLSSAWELIDPSWIRGLLRDDRRLVVNWAVRLGGGRREVYPTPVVWIWREDAPRRRKAAEEETEGLRAQYGILDAYSSSELVLAPPGAE